MILIVEDDADLAETCAMLLRACGYEAAVTHCGNSAMNLMQLALPQLLLADCFMPGMTGEQLCDHLYAVHGVVPFPIILMSGSCPSMAAPGKRYDAFIRKPFLAESLLVEVRRLIGAPRAIVFDAVRTIH